MAKETKRKVLINWNNSEDQENEAGSLEKKTIKNEPAHILRKNAEIILADAVEVTLSEKFTISYTFENLPEWSIPHFRLKYFFTSGTGLVLEDSTFVPRIYDVWTQDGNSYIFSLVMNISQFSLDSEDLQLFLTASLLFDNPRIFNELQFNKA